MLLVLCITFFFLFFTLVVLLATSFSPPTLNARRAPNDREKPTSHDLKNQHVTYPTTPTTVIIGAGIIEFCTAYHLAKTHHRRNAHKVLVVEAAEQAFAAASGSNTGILTDFSSNKGLLDLAQYSYHGWETLKDELSSKCGYKEGVNYSVKHGSGTGQNLLPEWVRREAEWDAVKDPDHGKMAIM